MCLTFGAAYLKSRSSDSFTAALKDFVPPVAVNVSNCGGVRIHKVDDLGTPLAGAVFTLFKDNAPIGGVRGAEDTITPQTCTTGADGFCTISNVLAGEYWVVETSVPPGYDGAADQHVTVDGGHNRDAARFRRPAAQRRDPRDQDAQACRRRPG